MTALARHESIVEAAIEEFARNGFQGTTVAQVAASAGCSEPNLYKHFTDKRALLVASLERTESLVEGELDRAASTTDPLTTLFDLVYGSTAYRRMLLLRMLCTTMPDDADMLERLRGGTERLLDRFAVAIERRKALGLTPQDVDAEHVGWTWLGLSLAACHHMLVDGVEQFDEVMAVGERYLRAMFSETSRPA
jgi:AcrR family transcriptional regulator